MANGNEDLEKMVKILLIDFDNTVVENISPEQEAELLVWKKILVSEDLWNKLLELEVDDKKAASFFEASEYPRRKSFFMFGVACAIGFVQANFTGPDLTQDVLDFFKSSCFQTTDFFADYLTLNVEVLDSNVNLPCLLAAAKFIFKNCPFHPLINAWWSWRVNILHQLVMEVPCPQLAYEAEKALRNENFPDIAGHIRAKFEIEKAQFFLHHKNIEKVDYFIKSAADILGVEYELVVNSSLTNSEEIHYDLKVRLKDRPNLQRPPVHKFPVPRNLKGGPVLSSVQILPNTEQKLLLLIAKRNASVKSTDDEVIRDDSRPFLEMVLNQNNTWPVRTAALILRCELDQKYGENLERCLAQPKEILNCYKKNTPHPMTRIGGVYATGLQTIWNIECLYADSLMYIGGKAKEASEIYMKQSNWNRLVANQIDLKKSSLKSLKTLYNRTKNPRYLCWLGELTDNISLFEQAWMESRTRNFRAQRCWGLHLYNKEQYEDCLPHLQKSLSINPLQPDVWRALGYAALECEKWSIVATALRRHVFYEPESYRSWINLAEAYEKTNNKRCAHQAFAQALKGYPDSLEMWEKFMGFATDFNHFSDFIKAYEHLLELDSNYLNIDALRVLVYCVTHNLNDHQNKKAGCMLEPTRKLLGKVVAIHHENGTVWELYAEVASSLDVKFERLAQAYTAHVKMKKWHKKAERRDQVFDVCRKLAYIALHSEIDSKDEIIPTVRFNISSVLSYFAKSEREDVKRSVQDITSLLVKIIQKARPGKAEHD